MRPVFTGTEVRAAERPLIEAGLGPELMRRAAHGLALHTRAALRETRGGVYGGRVVALVGKGNNGGDALYALALLRRHGVDCTAVLLHQVAHEGGLAAFRAAGGRIILDEGYDAGARQTLPASNAGVLGAERVIRTLEAADVVLDAVLGTGARVEADTERRAPLAGLRVRRAKVFACDLPSGVDADTGAALAGVLPADVTVTFGALKVGLVLGQGATLAGRTVVVDIGLDPHLPAPQLSLFESGDAPDTRPAPEAHKYSRGVLGLVAGSDQYPGAAVLTARAAAGAGLGMLYTVATGRARSSVSAAVPEAVELGPDLRGANVGRVTAWALGPGIGEEVEQRRVVGAVLERAATEEMPCAVDASALAMLDLPPGADGGVYAVLTPHAGELRRLLADVGVHVTGVEVANDPLRWARAVAVAYNAVVLLKGPSTVCVGPSGVGEVVTGAPATLATAGSGDVLTGLLGRLLAVTRPHGEAELIRCAAAAAHDHAQRALALSTEGFRAGELAGS